MNPESTVYPETSGTLWYYADANYQPIGPLSTAELHGLVASGVIGSTTQVIEDGGSAWRPFGEIALKSSAAKSNERISPPLTKTNTSPYTSVRKFTILALGSIYPLGLLMLWRYSDFSKRTKILVTSICSPIFLIGISSGLGIIATPVALLLIWVWLGKRFSRVSKIALTAVCTVLFLPILLQHRQSTSYAGKSFPRESQGAEEATRPITPSPKVFSFRAGDECRVVKNALLFTDEAAYNDEVVSGKKTGKIAAEDLRHVTVIAVNGFANLTRIRFWTAKHERAEVWTFPKDLEPELPEPKFEIDATVEVTQGGRLYSDPAVLLAYREAKNKNDAERVKELGAKLDTDAIVVTTGVHGKIVETNPPKGLYLVDGAMANGGPFIRWASARTMERFLTPKQKQAKADLESQQRNTTTRYAIQAGGLGFADRNAVLELLKIDKGNDSEADKKAARTELRLSQEKQGRRLVFNHNYIVRIVNEESGTEFREVVAENTAGLKSPRFWIHKSFLLGQDDLWGSEILTGYMIFRGKSGTEVENADVSDLLDLLVGVYDGKISTRAASKCVFMPEAQSGETTPIEVETVLDKYIIYAGRYASWRPLVKFAMPSIGGEDHPLGLAPVRFIGREQFSTNGGVVLSLPVVVIEKAVK